MNSQIAIKNNSAWKVEVEETEVEMEVEKVEAEMEVVMEVEKVEVEMEVEKVEEMEVVMEVVKAAANMYTQCIVTHHMTCTRLTKNYRSMVCSSKKS